MYTVVGAICGTLLVVFLVLSFLTYRKRRLTRRTYQFNFDVNYLRSTSLSGSLVSDNNNSYVMEPTNMQEVRLQIIVVVVVVVFVVFTIGLLLLCCVQNLFVQRDLKIDIVFL